jgi:hypothetical protein
MNESKSRAYTAVSKALTTYKYNMSDKRIVRMSARTTREYKRAFTRTVRRAGKILTREAL